MSGKWPKRKARPDVDEYGRTPLHYAASDGVEEEVARLLAAGMNPNAADDNGWTPLHYAAQAQSAEATRALLAAARIPTFETPTETPFSGAPSLIPGAQAP